MAIDRKMLRAAISIQWKLASGPEQGHRALSDQVAEVIWNHQRLRHAWGLLCTALQRDWQSAGRQVRRDLDRWVSRLQEHLRCIEQLPSTRPPLPDLQMLLFELRQLEEEFDELRIDLREKWLEVSTPSIQLKDVELGPFTIRLRWGMLGHKTDSSCFACIAEEPNEASSKSGVTHPHVQDKELCAGDAQGAIGKALASGRIADAFLLVRSVLSTYNPHSAYVALEHWGSSRCGACGRRESADDLSYCQSCDTDCCQECIGCCDICENTCCRNCLERDTVAKAFCCPNCRNTCRRCNRTVNSKDFDKQAGLCPQCLQKERAHDHESEQDAPAAAQPAAAA